MSSRRVNPYSRSKIDMPEDSPKGPWSLFSDTRRLRFLPFSLTPTGAHLDPIPALEQLLRPQEPHAPEASPKPARNESNRFSYSFAGKLGQKIVPGINGQQNVSSQPDRLSAQPPSTNISLRRSDISRQAPAGGATRLSLRPGSLPDVVAQADRQWCINQCTALTLMVPPALRPGSMEQCLAHCEGKSLWPQFLPYIPFG
jgi:hypothetical protein